MAGLVREVAVVATGGEAWTLGHPLTRSRRWWRQRGLAREVAGEEDVRACCESGEMAE